MSLGKSIDEVQKYQLALEEFVGIVGTGSDPIISTPKPKINPTTRTTKFSILIIDLHDPCPICNNFYDNHKFVVASCDCVCHPWCIIVHVELFNTCAKVSCGKPLNQKWCTNMGYKSNLNVGDQHELHACGWVNKYLMYLNILLCKFQFV
jgi:hypothetical protein